MKFFMKIVFPIFTAALGLIQVSSALADTGKQPFTISGRPVPDVVAVVNGIELHSNLIRQEMTAFKMMSAQQGHDIKAESEDKIAREILNREIDQELIYQKARMMNVNVPEEIVLQEIKKIEDQFPSEEIFDKALAMQYLTRGLLREKVEKQLVAEQFLRKEIIPKVRVEESDAEKYYKDNKASFMKPEMFEVSHIFVQTLNPAQQGKTEDPEAKKKAARIIEGINKDARKKIDAIAAKLKKGENFSKLAQEFSEDEATKDKGGSLGTLVPETTIPEIASAMTKLQIGETGTVIQSSFGYHIIRLNNKVASQLAPFEEIKSDILNMLLMRETEKYKEEFVIELKKAADIKILI